MIKLTWQDGVETYGRDWNEVLDEIRSNQPYDEHEYSREEIVAKLVERCQVVGVEGISAEQPVWAIFGRMHNAGVVKIDLC